MCQGWWAMSVGRVVGKFALKRTAKRVTLNFYLYHYLNTLVMQTFLKKCSVSGFCLTSNLFFLICPVGLCFIVAQMLLCLGKIPIASK